MTDFFFRSHVENFLDIKEKCMDAITSMGTFSFKNKGQHISNMDYHLGPDISRPYAAIVRPIFEEHNKKVVKAIHPDASIDIVNMWFQQYDTGDYHSIHTHPYVNFSNIFYLELESPTQSTKFIKDQKEFIYPVEEGDILTFPGHIPHTSPYNNLGRKTTIVFNTNISM